MNDKTKLDSKFWLKVFGVAVAVLLVYYALQSKMLTTVLGVLEPITIGVVFAYLLNPLMTVIEKLLKKPFGKLFKKEKTVSSLSRCCGIFFSLIIALSLVAFIVYLIVPELYSSVVSSVNALPGQIDALIGWYNKIVADYDVVNSVVEQGLENVKGWLQTDLIKTVGQLSSGVISTVSTTFNVIVGIIAAVYLLASKERLLAQIKKLLYAFFETHRVDRFIRTSLEGHRIMSKFIIGKLIDSAIIGVLCFIVLAIFRIPYALLVSVIVGVTNVIPFFGPFIGAVPSAALIMLNDPLKGLYFIIIIVVLQQIDGNLIGPKILGDSTGLSPFWVMFAIIVGGGLFGFFGMVVGVPALAIIFFVIRELSNAKLKKKHLPVQSSEYIGSFDAEAPYSKQGSATEAADNDESAESYVTGADESTSAPSDQNTDGNAAKH